MKKHSFLYVITTTSILFSFFSCCVLFIKNPSLSYFSANNITTLLGVIISCASIVITAYLAVLAINAYGKIREIDTAKKDAEKLIQKASAAEKIIDEAKKNTDEVKGNIEAFEKKREEIENMSRDITALYETNKRHISGISREMCEILVAFTETAVIHSEKERNKKLREKSLGQLYRLSYKYPDLLDRDTRKKFLRNLSAFGNESDITPLKIICNSKTEHKEIRDTAKFVLETLMNNRELPTNR